MAIIKENNIWGWKFLIICKVNSYFFLSLYVNYDNCHVLLIKIQ